LTIEKKTQINYSRKVLSSVKNENCN